MADRTITAANSVYMITIPGVFSVPQRLQGFSADAAFETEDVEPAEVQMGVDGRMSVGFVFTPTMQGITIQADSPSDSIFDAWAQASRAAREVFVANGTIILPGPQKSYVMERGVLTRYAAIPSVRRVMQARNFRITWERVSPTPYSPVS